MEPTQPSGAAARRSPIPVLVAVSGGADSMALLLACVALCGLKRRMSPAFEPIVLHVHHHLRPEADREARWVQTACRRLGVICHVLHIHPGNAGGNIYANARRLRLEAMASLAKEVGARQVLVAHHADDQLETMLMALCRGAGPHGLAGIRPSRRFGELTLLRPLLQVRKDDCRDLCRAAGMRWLEDPSNRDRTRRRSRMRRDVTPVLEELWPGAAQRAAVSARMLAGACEALEQMVLSAFGPPENDHWTRSSLRRAHEAVIVDGLFRAAVHADSSLADSLGGANLLQAAEAIRSDDRTPREFRWSRSLRLSVTSRDVRLVTRRD